MFSRRAITNYLFKPIDAASVGVFRIAFGLLGFLDILNTYIYYHLRIDAYNPQKFQFPYIGFEWVRVFPEPFMTTFLVIMMTAAICIMLGLRYRIAATIFASCFTYLFLIEKAHYLNHGYLFCWLSWIMVLLPANVIYSIDALRNPAIRHNRIPYYSLFVLQFLMAVVYFFGGVAKLNTDWLQAIPLVYWLDNKADIPLVGSLLAHEMTPWLMSYGGLFFDLGIVFLLLNRKTRTFGFSLAIFFHTLNAIVFNIGIFPYLSLALTALFFPPDYPRSLLNRWSRETKTPNTDRRFYPPSAARRLTVSSLLLALIAVHLFLPLRHHLFKGDVAWNEHGHRYAWRMMLRSKQGQGLFITEDRQTGEKNRIRTMDYLTAKQTQKMMTHPDMILQFAHYLRERAAAEGRDVAVYADLKVSLNGRKAIRFVDPAANLADMKWNFFKTPDWIVPIGR